MRNLLPGRLNIILGQKVVYTFKLFSRVRQKVFNIWVIYQSRHFCLSHFCMKPFMHGAIMLEPFLYWAIYVWSHFCLSHFAWAILTEPFWPSHFDGLPLGTCSRVVPNCLHQLPPAFIFLLQEQEHFPSLTFAQAFCPASLHYIHAILWSV